MPYSISIIEGIRPDQKEKFKSAGIISVEQLIAKSSTAERRSELQEQTGLDLDTLLRLIKNADRYYRN